MKRPIVFILLFLCLGIFSNFYFNDITIIIFTIGLFAFNTLLFLRHKSKYVYLFFIFYILGMLLTIDIASVQTNQQYEITGVIKDIDTNNYTSNVLVSVENINSNKEDFNILLITKDFSLEIGDKIQFTSTLQDFQKYEYIYNKSKNIDYKTYCDDILVIGQSKNFNYYSNKIVTLFSSIYDQVFFEEEANIVKALILGTKDDISTYTKDLYTKGGIIHILSLSGLHITILATALFFILSTFIRSNLKNILIILFLIFYLFLTGNVISTRRAVLMSTCVLMAPILKREYDLPSSICFSAIIILLTNPYSLFNISFILSYSAVIGLVLLTPKIEMCYNSLSIKSNNKILLKFNNLIKYLAPFIAVFISLQPILAYNFYYIYPYSIIVNALLSIFIAH